jgi:hypothetical protein
MYNNGIKDLINMTYYIPAQNGGFSENADAFLQFSHLTDIPTVVTNPPDPDDTVDFHFGECQLIQPIGVRLQITYSALIGCRILMSFTIQILGL